MKVANGRMYVAPAVRVAGLESEQVLQTSGAVDFRFDVSVNDKELEERE